MQDKILTCEQALEAICAQGCNYVNSVIVQLDAGQNSTQTEELSEQQKATLLLELKSIMSVYLKRDT